MKLIINAIALSVALVWANSAIAANIVWDGGGADGFWTSGPNNPGAGVGANWTIDAGTPGSDVSALVAAGTPGTNAIDYQFDNHDWVINGATISEDVQLRLKGGTLDIDNSTISLLPSSTNTPAFLSALNLGQSGTGTSATVDNSTITLSRSGATGSGGRALGLANASTLALANNAHIILQSEVGVGKMDLNNASTVTLDSTSSITADGQIDLFGAANTMTINGGSVDVSYLRANSGVETTQDIMITFTGGSFNVSDVNPFRDNSQFEGQFNWTGAAGSGTVTHTSASNTGSDLAKKVSQGFFSIDGTRIDPTTDSAVSGIGDLNTELATLAVGGRWFQVNDLGGNVQTLTLVPEPASFALLTLGGLMMIRRRQS